MSPSDDDAVPDTASPLEIRSAMESAKLDFSMRKFVAVIPLVVSTSPLEQKGVDHSCQTAFLVTVMVVLFRHHRPNCLVKIKMLLTFWDRDQFGCCCNSISWDADNFPGVIETFMLNPDKKGLSGKRSLNKSLNPEPNRTRRSPTDSFPSSAQGGSNFPNGVKAVKSTELDGKLNIVRFPIVL
jgi:hypothetical protein